MTFINEMVEKLPRLNRVDAQIVMGDYYDARFGLFNHAESKARPLSSVAMFPCENYTERTPIYDAYKEYAERNYKELWGLSVKEFLDLPQYIVRMIRSITVDIMASKNTALEEVERSIKQTK